MSAQYLDTELPEATAGDTLSLLGNEARHAVKVARVSAKNPIVIFDGNGRQVFGTVTETGLTDENEVFLTYRVERVMTTPPPTFRKVLVQSLAKAGRDELAAQMATELGVTEIVPWQSERSVVRWDKKKAEKNLARWQQIVTDAAKQSLNPFIPRVLPMVTGTQAFGDLQSRIKTPSTLLMLDPTADAALFALLKQFGIEKESAHTVVLFIGPEGGFSEAEIRALEHAGGVKARLGNLVLRSSTAGPVALTLMNQYSGEWDSLRNILESERS